MQLFVGVRKSWRTCGMMLKCFWPLLRRKQVRRSGLQVHRTNAPTTIINKNTTKQNFQQNSKRDFATTLRIFQFWCHCLATALQVSIHTMSLWSFCNDNDWHVLACTWWNQVMLLLKRTIVFCTVRSACRYYTRATRCSSGLNGLRQGLPAWTMLERHCENKDALSSRSGIVRCVVLVCLCARLSPNNNSKSRTYVKRATWPKQPSRALHSEYHASRTHGALVSMSCCR